MMKHDFGSSTVLVTGAARGVGLAISRAFHENGARLILTDVDCKAVEEAARSLGCRAHHYAFDVSSPEAVKSAVAEISAEHGPVDILINNAGICSTEGFLELEVNTWNSILGVNLTGAFLLSREIAAVMVKNGIRGRIINIGSLAGRSGGILVSAAYSASKAGIAGLTRAAARQLAEYGITVNCIAPGTLETELIAGWEESKVENIRNSIPLGRLGDTADVAGAVLYLASRDAAYITGITIDVNGGLYIAP